MRITAEIVKAFAPFPELSLLILYGSWSRGRQHAGSDIDLAVAGAAPLTVERRVELTLALQRTLQMEVDLVDLHTAYGVLLDQILDRGIVVLKRDPSLYAAFLIRRMGERADFRRQYDAILSTRRKRFIDG